MTRSSVFAIVVCAVVVAGCGSSTWEPARPDGWVGEGFDVYADYGSGHDYGPGHDFGPGVDNGQGLDFGPGYDPGPDHTTINDVVYVDPGKDSSAIEDIPAVIDEGPDEEPPKVISAFSTDGKGVTVRFSEPLDPSTANNAQNFTVVAGGSTIVAVPSVFLHNEVFVDLALDPSHTINPNLNYQVRVENVTDLAGNKVDSGAKTALVKRLLYLAIVWHQHQPFYGDAAGMQLSGPWVRKHSTKDYYDMAAILEDYPDVHVTINLTAVMLIQLIDYYLNRMGDVDDDGKPLVDVVNNVVNEDAFLAKYRGMTDPWVDLLLDDTPDPLGLNGAMPTDKQKELFYDAPWSCLSTSSQLMYFFPEYQGLRDKAPTSYDQDDLRLLKILFELAWFDPDFLNGPVPMPDGTVVDLSDIVDKDALGRFTLAVEPTEELANRLVAENYKIMKNVVAIHRELRFDPEARTGQIEISTTPFYHPILPLIVDSNLAAQGQPFDTLPDPPYQYEGDGFAQVAKAVKFYRDLFSADPHGMWPGEGSVAEAVVSAFVDNGLLWIATDQDVLKNTREQLMGTGTPAFYQCEPYRIDSDTQSGDGGSASDEMAIVFRDTGISNKIGFNFQPLSGTDATSQFLADVSAMAPRFGGGDRLATIILDGENAWESYSKEHDGKGFFRALYKALQDGFTVGEVISVTPAEYILGNPERNVPAHPVHDFDELEPLWAGSWISGTFAVWIGESEENTGWEYLLQARRALANSNLPRPNPLSDVPTDTDSLVYKIYKAWEEMYAAEGSDWFWWYGQDMTSPSNDDSPFDLSFRSHLSGMYSYINDALTLQGKATIAVPDFAPIVQAKPSAPSGPFPTDPVIDGKEEPPTEWGEGGLFYDNDSGAIANPDDHISGVKFGYSDDKFFCAMVTNNDLSSVSSGYKAAVYLSQKHIVDPDIGSFEQNPYNTVDRWGRTLDFVTGGAAWELLVDLSKKPATVTWSKADGAGNWTAVGGSTVKVGGPVSGGKLLEFEFPFADLDIETGDPLEFAVAVGDGSRVIDYAPNFSGKVVFEDASSLVFVTFEVDCSGSSMALNTYGPITNLPPPSGKGIAYITGNQDKLANWIPNKIGLRDDGTSPDATADDNIWTGTYGFMPGTLLRYKYTIGIPTDESKWNGTEEFPLTERGFEVTKDPTCRGMKIRDVFADRPSPSGTTGPSAVMDDCVK